MDKRFGSLKNIARRLLEGVRFVAWADEWFDPAGAGKLRIGLDSSSPSQGARSPDSGSVFSSRLQT